MSASAASSSYRRVPQNEQQAAGVAAASGEASMVSSSSNNNNMMERSRGERFHDKCAAAVWIATSWWLAKWTSFYTVLWTSNFINRTLLNVSMVGLAVVIAQLFYLMLYLPKVKGLTDPSAWGVYCPKVVPIMGVTTLLSFLVLIRALWPLWGFLAPFYAGTQVMGWLMATHFVPTLGIC